MLTMQSKYATAFSTTAHTVLRYTLRLSHTSIFDTCICILYTHTHTHARVHAHTHTHTHTHRWLFTTRTSFLFSSYPTWLMAPTASPSPSPTETKRKPATMWPSQCCPTLTRTTSYKLMWRRTHGTSHRMTWCVGGDKDMWQSPCRNLRLFRCLFQLHHRIQRAVLLNCR